MEFSEIQCKMLLLTDSNELLDSEFIQTYTLSSLTRLNSLDQPWRPATWRFAQAPRAQDSTRTILFNSKHKWTVFKINKIMLMVQKSTKSKDSKNVNYILKGLNKRDIYIKTWMIHQE